MPNIEMYGFSIDEVKGIDSMIHELLEFTPYRDDYVTTFIESEVIDHYNRKQPFLRLVTTKNDHIDDILEELQKLKFDIEVMMLDRFIPKK